MYGLGFRLPFYEEVIQKKPHIDFFEFITEDYLVEGGNPIQVLDQIRSLYPITFHGVSMSIGSTDPLDFSYLSKLKYLIDYAKPLWISDHVCWTGVNGINLHDLMPLPYTMNALHHVIDRVKAVQDYLGQAIALENASSYIQYKASTMPEWIFMAELAEKSDCFLLLDINNIYVNAYNHRFDAIEYLRHIPSERVKQYHLAGHKVCQSHIIDTHDRPIQEDVWDLYQSALQIIGEKPIIIERDADIPPLSELLAELDRVRHYHAMTV